MMRNEWKTSFGDASQKRGIAITTGLINEGRAGSSSLRDDLSDLRGHLSFKYLIRKEGEGGSWANHAAGQAVRVKGSMIGTQTETSKY